MLNNSRKDTILGLIHLKIRYVVHRKIYITSFLCLGFIVV